MSESTAPLDARQFRQSLAILDREHLSPADQRLFRWLNWAVWGTFAFSIAWFVVLLSQYSPLQSIPLALALGSFAVAVLLFFGNVTLLTKLWRAARTERRLGISHHVSALTRRITSQRGWPGRWLGGAPLILIPLGLVFTIAGGLGVVAQLWNFSLRLLPLPVGLCAFGLACLCLYPMARSKRRLEAVARLRATLLDRKDLEGSARDLLTTFERTQILVDRKQGAAANRPVGKRSSGVQFTPAFHESLSQLDPVEMSHVYAALRLLLEHLDGDSPTSSSSADGGQFDVPDTSLAIAFTRDPASGGVRANALYRSGQPIEVSDEGTPREEELE